MLTAASSLRLGLIITHYVRLKLLLGQAPSAIIPIVIVLGFIVTAIFVEDATVLTGIGTFFLASGITQLIITS